MRRQVLSRFSKVGRGSWSAPADSTVTWTTLWNKLLRLIWRFGHGWWEASVKCIREFPLWTALRYAITLNLWLQASEKWVKYWRLRWNKVNVQPSIVRLGRSPGSTCFWIQGLRNSTPLRFPFGISDCHQQNARDFARILYLGRACWLVWRSCELACRLRPIGSLYIFQRSN